jgi:hypothetical protein
MSRQARQSKGQITPMDLLIVAMVFFIGVGLFILVDFLVARDIIISKQTIYLSMETDDRGSELISLLGSTSAGMSHMEIVGDMSATGYEQYIKEGLDGLKDVTKRIGSGYSLSGLEAVPAPTTISTTCIYDDSGQFPGKMEWPMWGTRISDEPGWRYHPIDRVCKCHSGVDIAGDGLEVKAAADGDVKFAGWTDGGYGNMVKISHEGGYETWYAHLKEILVKEGQRVIGGETVIGISGSTGKSTGPHLHFELRKDDKPIDPCKHMERTQSGCYVKDRCTVTPEKEIYVTQVPVPGAQSGNLKKTAELVET